MEEIVERLQQIELFSQVKERDLERIAGLFARRQFDRDDYVTHQGEAGDALYVLQAGAATVWRMDSRGVERLVDQLKPGDYFGVTGLFLDEPRDTSVKVSEGSVVLMLTRASLTDYLEQHRAVRKALLVPEEIRRRLEAPRFDWMAADEYVVFYASKSRWVLLWGELVPMLLLSALITATVAMLAIPLLSIILAVVAAVGGLGWVILRWMDWRNDYYVVTNKRVFSHESRLPALQVTVDQAPLHQIQNVNLLKPTPLAQALNYGSLILQTAGRTTGSITFHQVDDPADCQQAVFELVEKTKSLVKSSERAAIREAIAEQLDPREPADKPAEEFEPERSYYVSGQATWDMGEAPTPSVPEDEIEVEPWLVVLGQRFNALLPHFREQVGDVVIWHKHPFILIKRTWIPALLLLALVSGAILWVSFIGGNSFESVVLILFVGCCLDLFWLFWRYEDWRNDIFQMTASHILDIDRLPLGFRESRRQAALEQVQNINVDIPNLWARIFNYGNVMIETAGSTGDLTFEWVMQPRAVQAEIFDRIESMRVQQRKEETERRRQEMAEWFAVYHQIQTERS